ncbi:MAG: hypothetical protein CMI55_00580 [Parcubacteria group bacterium]|jgi:UDP-N-acetylmuramoyl-tripeptide--D-alanyl-D-alanine ligase|nr:hypothetical protein [Parcubacteria group bacterium]|tara:strand:+ start:13012 stop:14313 length:1302 start_codon:yes stop_codon:yes gene_type:complete
MYSILQYILKILAKMIIWRYGPEIVAVTGSVGKTSTKEAIYRVLKGQFRVRQNIGSYNNEIGTPLTILGFETGGHSLFSWLKIFLRAITIVFWQKDYPEILILEMGVDKPGDMEYLTSFIPVKIGVITAIGQFPVHLEFFPEKGRLVEEKSLLVKSLTKGGLAVLNYDDLTVRMIGADLAEATKTVKYGFGQGADFKISNFQFSLTSQELKKQDLGISFKLEYQGSIVPIRLVGVLGKQQAFAAAAAAAVGSYFGLNLVEISTALKKYRSLPGRVNLLKGIKQTWIIDDSYNASPTAVSAALDILKELGSHSSGRRIAVLGDMLELGEETEAAHRTIGQKVVEVVDLLFTVGDRARFIAEEALKYGLAQEKVFDFPRAEDAALPVQQEVEKGDIILVKGSQSIRTEKIVKEIMAQPEKANELLVRQTDSWLGK